MVFEGRGPPRGLFLVPFALFVANKALIHSGRGSIRSRVPRKLPSPVKKQPAKTRKVGAVALNRPKGRAKSAGITYPDFDAVFRPEDAIVAEGPEVLQPSKLAYRDDIRGIYLYHGDCLKVMDTLLVKHPGGVFDMIFADLP